MFIPLIILAVKFALANAIPVNISVDLSDRRRSSKLLYGIFFEEIGHAGEGGLYAEMIEDRSFDALAHTTGFSQHKASVSHDLRPADFQAQGVGTSFGVEPFTTAGGRHQLGAHPLTTNNPVAMNVTAHKSGGGLANTGYWGIPLVQGSSYHFSVYLQGNAGSEVRVLLKAQNSTNVYGEATLRGLGPSWSNFSANISANATDFRAEVALQLLQPGSVLLDSLSLFPRENIRAGWQNPYPFRRDLLQHLQDLKPRFLRFPGGCYVEGGDWLRNRFPWATNLGPNENRTGHLNDVWGYWSTDGLGLYEYMLLAEELGAEPIYVVNNGFSHLETTSPELLRPFLDETLGALEFLTGDASRGWGAVRASMGRHKPWEVNYLGVGNEDCGKPHYVESYREFYTAIKKVYPNITLIANCNLAGKAPTDLWDWHHYGDSWDMFNRRHDFDGMQRGYDPPVFVSEYAVQADGGWGNLRAAVAEAGFMTGLERNSDIVQLAAYAPLFVHAEDHRCPTNLVVFDNHRSYKTPSALVQQLFAAHQGKLTAATRVEYPSDVDVHNQLLAASTTVSDPQCQTVVIKIASFSSFHQDVSIDLGSGEFVVGGLFDGEVHSISGPHPEAENCFEEPHKVAIESRKLSRLGISADGNGTSVIKLAPWSAYVIVLDRKEVLSDE